MNKKNNKPKKESMDPKIVEYVLSCGVKYQREHLDPYKEVPLRESSWEALVFLFDRAFYQGRRDDVSEKVEKAAKKVLKDHPYILGMRYTDKDLPGLEKELRKVIGNKGKKGNIGKPGDVRMVISILEYVKGLPNRNIVTYTVERIEKGEVAQLYKELMDRIFQVGPKIASLHLRDIVSLFKLNRHIPKEALFCLQPIDRWVRRLLTDEKVGILPTKATDRQIRTAIVDLCMKYKCSSIQFNQGAWYVGANAYKLLFEMLNRPL